MARILFKRGLEGILPALIRLTMALTSAQGAVRSWKASTTGEWFVAANWVEGAVPDEDDDVFITNANASVLLTNSTPNLASLTVSRTLIATNWNTTISAREIRIVPGGMITTPVVTNNSSVSNRVLIVCSNLTLETGGQINVNSKGYGGGWAANNQGRTNRSMDRDLGPAVRRAQRLLAGWAASNGQTPRLPIVPAPAINRPPPPQGQARAAALPMAVTVIWAATGEERFSSWHPAMS